MYFYMSGIIVILCTTQSHGHIRGEIGDVIPGMPIQTLLQTLLVQIVTFLAQKFQHLIPFFHTKDLIRYIGTMGQKKGLQ